MEYGAYRSDGTRCGVPAGTDRRCTGSNSGDAEYLHKVRSLTDCYNALMLIAIEFMFWIMWNIVRTVYRILCDFKKF